MRKDDLYFRDFRVQDRSCSLTTFFFIIAAYD